MRRRGDDISTGTATWLYALLLHRPLDFLQASLSNEHFKLSYNCICYFVVTRMASYKEAKEAFVSHTTGSTLTQVMHISSITVVSAFVPIAYWDLEYRTISFSSAP